MNKKIIKQKLRTVEEQNSKKIALIYCRVSSMTQNTDGSGLESQEHRCRQYCEVKGYEVEKVFKDSVTGGGDFLRRPAMVEMLNYLDQHAHKNYMVVFDDLKRFARDVNFHFKLRNELDARGVTPECLGHKFDDSPEGEFLETILAAQNQLERKQNRRQVIQKQKARLESGYWPFFPPPGYITKKIPGHGKVLTPKNPEARCIKEALEGFASNRFPQPTDVLKFLIRKKFIKNNGKNHLQRVLELLNRAYVYAGYIEYQPWEVSRRDGHHKALISRETLNRIELKLSSKIKNPIREDANSDFPLRGFLTCAGCGQNFTASWSTSHTGRKYPYYRCATKKCPYQDKSSSRDIVEGRFCELIRKLTPKTQLVDMVKAKLLAKWNEAKNNIVDIEKGIGNRIIRYQIEVKKLVLLIRQANSQDVIKVYEEEIAELRNKGKIEELKLAKIKNEEVNFGTALNKVLQIIINPYSEWENGDLGHRQLILRMIFSTNLNYNIKEGFETPDFALPIKVFEQISNTNSPAVEVAGIEPACE